MKACENCGTRKAGEFCPNCHEEVFIEAQYGENGEPVPSLIASSANKHREEVARMLG